MEERNYMKMEYITNSREETTELGRKIADQLNRKNRIFALFGELGSGKTTFVQGLAKGLRIKKRILSPTFVIIRTYNLKSQISKRKTTTQNLNLFYHVDLYRINNVNEIRDLGLEEIINDPENIVAIEWAEKIGRLLSKNRLDIYFEYIDENKRRIRIRYG